MKSIITASIILCSLFASAQRIKVSETDAATHIHRISTTARWVNKSCSNGFSIALRSEDTAVFVQLSLMPTTTSLIAGEDELIFQLANNEIIVAQSKGMQVRSAEYNHPIEYRIALGDVQKLYGASIKSIGYYNAGGKYTSFDIESASQNDMQQVCNVFLQEYQKTALANENLARLSLVKK